VTPAAATPTILIVDDTPQNISLLNAALKDEYNLLAATSGQQALDICQSMPVDLVLLDVMMPDMDGFETCRRLKHNPLTQAIPVIFVTARGEVEDEETGFACGAVDYITKPIRASIVRTRVATHLALHNQNLALNALVKKRTEELQETQIEILHRLGSAGEYRDNETGCHILRVCNYSRILALAFGLPESQAEHLYNAAALHDIGKIGIPDSILLKPGKLDNDELKTMRTHSEIGFNIIGTHKNRLIRESATIALTHHERWDGHGYPNRLRGSDIPLLGRIVGLADVFDALTSVRPYKKAWPLDEAVAEIVRCRGEHFDPQLVDAFLSALPEFEVVLKQFADESAPENVLS
jgi:putative two-component system response regulator